MKPQKTTIPSKNEQLLKEFTAYCQENPDQRFWQALKNWSEADEILYKKLGMAGDTYEWNERIGTLAGTLTMSLSPDLPYKKHWLTRKETPLGWEDMGDVENFCAPGETVSRFLSCSMCKRRLSVGKQFGELFYFCRTCKQRVKDEEK